MTNKRKQRAAETVTAWAWEIQDPDGKWGLCHWSQPWEAVLRQEEKPSDEARAVCVRMIRNSDYIKAGLRSRKVKEQK